MLAPRNSSEREALPLSEAREIKVYVSRAPAREELPPLSLSQKAKMTKIPEFPSPRRGESLPVHCDFPDRVSSIMLANESRFDIFCQPCTQPPSLPSFFPSFLPSYFAVSNNTITPFLAYPVKKKITLSTLFPLFLLEHRQEVSRRNFRESHLHVRRNLQNRRRGYVPAARINYIYFNFPAEFNFLRRWNSEKPCVF